MKKLLLLTLPVIIFAKSFMISNIPLPRTYIQNLDPYNCDNICLQEYLQKDMIFSFLAHADGKLSDRDLDEARVMNISILHIGAYNNEGELKIALLLPYKKIGKYAASTVNATFAYLMTKSNPFNLKTYRVESEDPQDLQKALTAIENDGFHYVIATVTKKGAQNIVDLDPSLYIYFPTINTNNLAAASPYYIFGAIDYNAQSKMLLKEAVSPLVIFSDKSRTGQVLAHYEEEEFLHPTKTVEEDVEENGVFGSFFNASKTEQKKEVPVQTATNRRVVKYFIPRKTTNLAPFIKKNKRLENASLFINTPTIKTGMLLSQLTLYDTNTTNVLSTQINYAPLLLSMTQYVDRKNMIIANSIIQNNDILIETNSLLGNDIIYDWINYTTTVGIDYFYSQITGEARDYNIPLQNNQMVYKIELLHPGKTKFLPYTSRREKRY